MKSKEMSSISARTPSSSRAIRNQTKCRPPWRKPRPAAQTTLNELKRTLLHLGAIPDQQPNKLARIQRKCHPSWRKSRAAAAEQSEKDSPRPRKHSATEGKPRLHGMRISNVCSQRLLPNDFFSKVVLRQRKPKIFVTSITSEKN